jgi:hypothetical protein
MRFLLVLFTLSLISCQQEQIHQDQVSSPVSSALKNDELFADKDESCADSELTEDKIVQQAMKPVEVNEAGALQGASDCTVD